jgi:hypothetical protein
LVSVPDATSTKMAKDGLAFVFHADAIGENIAAIDVHILDHALIHGRVGGQLDAGRWDITRRPIRAPS